MQKHQEKNYQHRTPKSLAQVCNTTLIKRVNEVFDNFTTYTTKIYNPSDDIT